ncbi:MAG: SGNH/GDSL hydrolase family protein, partial [Myxococcota bacterium]
EPMPEVYPRSIPTEPGAWSFSPEPDVVVINLGTNDFSTDGDPTETQFVTTYVAFLELLRSRYPDALVMCTVAPLLSGDDEMRAVAYVQSAVSQRNTAGDDDVIWIDLRVEPVGWGCDWHPSVATHEAMAEKLIASLEAELGW